MATYATCSKCGGTMRRSSTPMVHEDGRKQFWQHQNPDDLMFWQYRCPVAS